MIQPCRLLPLQHVRASLRRTATVGHEQGDRGRDAVPRATLRPRFGGRARFWLALLGLFAVWARPLPCQAADCAALLSRATAELQAKQHAQALDTLRQAENACRADRSQLAVVHRGFALAYVGMSSPLEAMQHLREYERYLHPQPLPANAAEAYDRMRQQVMSARGSGEQRIRIETPARETLQCDNDFMAFPGISQVFDFPAQPVACALLDGPRTYPCPLLDPLSIRWGARFSVRNGECVLEDREPSPPPRIDRVVVPAEIAPMGAPVVTARAAVPPRTHPTWRLWTGLGGLAAGGTAMGLGLWWAERESGRYPAGSADLRSAESKAQLGLWSGVTLMAAGAGLLTWELIDWLSARSRTTDTAPRVGVVPSDRGLFVHGRF
jgi:hypothetical protein